MDWTSFGRVRTAMTVRDYDIVMLALKFDEGIEEPTTDSFDWIRKLRSQPGFPEMIIVAEGGSELAAIRTLRLGAADYLPKRLITPPRLQRSIKLTLRAIDKESQRRAERLALRGRRVHADRRHPDARRQGRRWPRSRRRWPCRLPRLPPHLPPNLLANSWRAIPRPYRCRPRSRKRGRSHRPITRFRATPSCRRSASRKRPRCIWRSPRISATTSR